MSDLDRQVRLKLSAEERKDAQLAELQAMAAEFGRVTNGEVNATAKKVDVGILEGPDTPAMFSIEVGTPFTTPDFQIPRYKMTGTYEPAKAYMHGLANMIELLSRMSGDYREEDADVQDHEG